MKFQKQAFRHRPEVGEYGDCLRTAYACLLDLDRDSVPNFGEHWETPGAVNQAGRAWLASQGLVEVNYPFYVDTLERLLDVLGGVWPDLYYLLSGISRNGTAHVVVACGGEIVWDTALDDSGIVAPIDGYFLVSHLVSAQMRRVAS